MSLLPECVNPGCNAFYHGVRRQIAEEAFATGLLCFLLFSDDPVRAIQRAAASSGDSDSIACLVGAFAGAAHGMAGWPVEWQNRIEYQVRLGRLGETWDNAWQ